MTCKGTCRKYKAKWGFNQFRYVAGQKRCNTCDIFLEWDGIWCPCCGRALRTRPRTSKYKKLYRENKTIRSLE